MPQGRGSTKPRKKKPAKEQPFGVLVTVTEKGYQATPTGGMGPMAIPTHLRAAANAIEAQLTKAV